MYKTGKIFEEYINTKYLKILTVEHLDIPGMHLFGKQIRTVATESLPPHNHNNCFEVVYICSGNPSFSVGGKTYILSGGDIFITQPYEVHSTNAIPVSVSEMFWFQLDLEACESPLFLGSAAVATLQQKLQSLSSRVISMDPERTRDLLQQAFRIAASGHNPQLAAQYISLLLFLVLESSEKVGFKLTPDIGRAATYILDHITERLTLEHLASISYLSVSQFKQKLKKQMGISPRQFINAQKIQYAKELLLDGYSTTEIAACLQFESPSYFITVFRRYTSCTPQEYRKLNLELPDLSPFE